MSRYDDDDRYDDDPEYYRNQDSNESDAEQIAAERERRLDADAEAKVIAGGYSPLSDSWGVMVAWARGGGFD